MNAIYRLSLPLGLLALAAAANAQVAVDAFKGPEWDTITPAHVSYNPLAPESNFGAPTNESDTTAYDIYLRSDNDYVYGLLQTTPANPGLVFANLYFSTDIPNGSNIGFEMGAPHGINDAFVPGGQGGYAAPAGNAYAQSASGVVEFAIPWSYFTDVNNAPGFTPLSQTNNKLQLRLSQSFGYSVAGGPLYGADRLGILTLPITNAVPEPASMAALGLGGLALLRRRKRA